jgi:hypothetical protein
VSLSDHVPVLERALTHLRKLDEVHRCHLLEDEEGLDMLLATLDLAELRATAVELEVILRRHEIFPPQPSPRDRRDPAPPRRHLAAVAPLDPYSRKV